MKVENSVLTPMLSKGIREIISMSHLCKLRHRRKILENLISEEQQIRSAAFRSLFHFLDHKKFESR